MHVPSHSELYLELPTSCAQCVDNCGNTGRLFHLLTLRYYGSHHCDNCFMLLYTIQIHGQVPGNPGGPVHQAGPLL